MSEISTALEAHREILLHLTAIAQLDPKAYFPSDNESLCRFCGIRPRRGNLCVECEARRERLAAQFPDVPPPIREARVPLSTRMKSENGMTALGAIQRPTWSPHNSE
jgi:hypothetical protein